MRVERFKAANTREAMTAVKNKLGAEAVVLHTRATFDGVEIIAAVDNPEQKKIPWPTIPDFPQNGKMSANIDRQNASPLVGDFVVDKSEDKAVQPWYRRPAQTTQAGKGIACHSHHEDGRNGKIGAITSTVDLTQRNSEQGSDPVLSAQLVRDPGQKAAEFAQALKEEISTIETSRQVWLQSEKRLDDLKRELAELKEVLLRQELADLQERAEKLRLERAARKAELLTAAEDKNRKAYFGKILVRLQERGVSPELAETIVVELKNQTQELDLGKEADVRRLQERFAQVLMNLIPVRKEDDPPSFSTKVIAMIGPAGAGKTSAGIKLAINSSLIQNKRVAMVLVSEAGSATARHLSLLANVAQLPLVIVQTPAQLKEIVAAHTDKDLILVDFARGQETDKQEEYSFSEFVAQIPGAEIHLVMPASQSLSESRQVLQEFAEEKYTHLLLTRLDQVKTMGTLLDLVRMAGKPLSYVCNGTVIPDHIEPASAAKLTRMILRG